MGGVTFSPTLLSEKAECGICHKAIHAKSVAHGHTWLNSRQIHPVEWWSFEEKIQDLFHKLCITNHFANSSACPSCKAPVLNTHNYRDYNGYDDSQRWADTSIFQTLVNTGDLNALEEWLQPGTRVERESLRRTCKSAIKQNNEQLLKILLKFGISDRYFMAGEHPISGYDLLKSATNQQRHRMVELLLGAGKEVVDDFTIHKCFQNALEKKDFAICDIFLNTLDFDSYGDWLLTMVFVASYDNSYHDGVDYGLSKAVLLRMSSESRKTLLHSSAWKGDSDMVLELLPLIPFYNDIGNFIDQNYDQLKTSQPDIALILEEYSRTFKAGLAAQRVL